MAKPRWLDEREARMWRAYLDMNRVLDLALDDQLAEHGLSSADYGVLVPLAEAPGHALRAGAIGRLIGWDRSRISHHLRRMEQRGLIERQDCPTDARGTIVQLTDRGRDALRAAAPGHVATVRRHLVDLLSPAELDLLTDIAERVRASAAPADSGCGETDEKCP